MDQPEDEQHGEADQAEAEGEHADIDGARGEKRADQAERRRELEAIIIIVGGGSIDLDQKFGKIPLRATALTCVNERGAPLVKSVVCPTLVCGIVASGVGAEVAMSGQADFLFRHANHLRQALIELEGEDGAFRLLEHAAIRRRAGRETLLAAVLSTNTDRRYLMVHDVFADIGDHDDWHPATAAERRRLRVELRGLPRMEGTMAAIETMVSQAC